MIIKRNQIVYIPYPSKGNILNDYTVNTVEILQKKYKVNGTLAEPADILEMLKTKAVFLNWVENRLDNKMKIQLFLYKLFGAKIIWVFHNKVPHDLEKDGTAVNNMNWLANLCDRIIIHSKYSKRYIPNKRRNQKKVIYVPHIMYESNAEKVDLNTIREKYGILESDFVFTIFGLIRPYKNIETAIEAFKKLNLPKARLLIAGNPVDKAYAKQIENLCINNTSIILDLKFLSNILLDGIIGISDVIVLPYNDKSSMNSGVMIKAFSNGKTIISPDICMARDFVKEGFFYGYRNSLEKVMKRAYGRGKEENRKWGEQARTYMEQKYCEKVVARQLFSAIE